MKNKKTHIHQVEARIETERKWAFIIYKAYFKLFAFIARYSSFVLLPRHEWRDVIKLSDSQGKHTGSGRMIDKCKDELGVK